MKTIFEPKKYVTNLRGKKVGVVLDIEGYRKILADLEELASIRAYDEAKLAKDVAIPLLKATKQIERSRI
jgi:hypothetical protein